LLPWLPWLLYVLPHWDDYLGQMRPAASRFDVLNPAFYTQNFLFADGPLSVTWIARTLRDLPLNRVGTWFTVLGLTATLPTLVVAIRRRRLSSAEMYVLFAAAALLLLFSALLSVKAMSYMIAIWPLAVLAIAWTVIRLTRAAPRPVGIALSIAVVLSAAEGLGRAAHARLAAEHVSDYESYTAQIASCIPAGSRVLGLQHYWLGLRQFEFRTWLLPFNLSRPGWYHEPLTLAQALRRVAPSVVLIDRYIATLLDENGSSGRPLYQDVVDVKQFMAESGARFMCDIKDRSYGTMLVYVLSRRRDLRQ
jgi:hypothetical protein